MTASLIPTHRHLKRGSNYEFQARGTLQAEGWTDAGFASVDMAPVAIYRDAGDGSWWARPVGEFEDGRFETLPFALPRIEALGRAELGELLGLLDQVEKVIGELPHRIAQPQMENIDAIRNSLLDILPGGFAAFCDDCGEPIGNDEIGASDYENGGHACKACVARDPGFYAAAALTAAEPPAPVPAPTPEGDRLRAEAASLLEASGNAALIDDAIELRMDAARSGEAARRADEAAVAREWIAWEAPNYIPGEGQDAVRPVTADTVVDIRMGDGAELYSCAASMWLWHSLSDPKLVITAYRLSDQPPTPTAD